MLIYLFGSWPSTWILIDFYSHRDAYTQKYCRYFDEGITQCRASCYLEQLLEKEQNDQPEAYFVSSQPFKMTEQVKNENFIFGHLYNPAKQQHPYQCILYQSGYAKYIFHPPKA